MDICIIHKGISKLPEIRKICDFGAVRLFAVSVHSKKGKGASKRLLKKILKLLVRRGITICIAEKELFPIQLPGITVIWDGEEFLKRRAGEAAIAFSEAMGIKKDFLIDGGSFRDVVRAAGLLLERKKHIYIRNPAFSELSEVIFEETGAVVRQESPEDVVIISMNESEGFIKYNEREADISDFVVRVSGLSGDALLQKNILPLASVLEKSGFLAKTRVKIEYFLE